MFGESCRKLTEGNPHRRRLYLAEDHVRLRVSNFSVSGQHLSQRPHLFLKIRPPHREIYSTTISRVEELH
ncbi:unnamed protein product [Nezara viridula]|uniref:Uncharacterized protein n=1 Tax=Nezara viridula TaxID=85310 RepID=A0A9P0EB14_NEZVI|nr:unnamed protein product [Nezara viridula]